MNVLLRALTRRNTSPNRGGSGGRNRTRREEQSGGTRQFEVILEMLASGLVEYAVRKYTPHKNDRDRDRDSRHDDRLRVRGHRDDDQRPRGGVPNMDVDMLEELGKTILIKAIEKFGGGGGEEEEGEEEERDEVRASGDGGGRPKRRGRSLDRYSHSRDREDHGEEHGRRGRGGYGNRPGEEHRRGGSPEAPRPRRDERHRRRRYGTDYAPLKTELEALSNAIISLNERQPGHADCEFYDAFVERSGKVQSAIGSVQVQIREREERREERRGRRRS